MKWYLKELADGVEYSPVGRRIDEAKLKTGFEVVDTIPQRIRDKEPGGKDYVEPEDPKDAKLRELEQRIEQLEAVKVQP